MKSFKNNEAEWQAELPQSSLVRRVNDLSLRIPALFTIASVNKHNMLANDSYVNNAVDNINIINKNNKPLQH